MNIFKHLFRRKLPKVNENWKVTFEGVANENSLIEFTDKKGRVIDNCPFVIEVDGERGLMRFRSTEKSAGLN